MVALNRAIAVPEVQGPGPALVMIGAIAPDLETSPAARGAGNDPAPTRMDEEARAAFECAADLGVTEADRRFLARQNEPLPEDKAQPPGAAG